MPMTLDQTLQLWNTVGTWVAGVATFLAVCLSLWLARRGETFQISAERRRNAAELYTLFSSAEIERARGDAWAFLCENGEKAAPLSYEQIHRCSSETLTAVTRVIQFWERTAHFLDARHVDEHLTKRLLKHFFESHYQGYLFRLVEVSKRRPDPTNMLEWTVAIQDLARRWQVPPRAAAQNDDGEAAPVNQSPGTDASEVPVSRAQDASRAA